MESVESTLFVSRQFLVHLNTSVYITTIKKYMSRFIPRFCLRQIVSVCCFVCSVSLALLFLNRLSLNDYVSASAVVTDLPRTELASEIQQLVRKNLILKQCRDTKTSISANKPKRKTVAVPVRFKMEDRHRVMYCDVPKVASTNLEQLMLILSGAVNKTDDLSTIPRTAVYERKFMTVLHANHLNDTFKNGVGDFSTKFIFVRHPFERLVSAYRDRLASNNTKYNGHTGREIIRKFRKHPSPLSLQNGHDATFPEFVDFIIDEWRKQRRPLYADWRPVVDLCRPCVMRFDFIGKFETLNQDIDFLLRKLNESDLARLFADQPKPKTTSSLWKEFMKTISYQQLKTLNLIYADDFRLFGYPHYYTRKEPLQ